MIYEYSLPATLDDMVEENILGSLCSITRQQEVSIHGVLQRRTL